MSSTRLVPPAVMLLATLLAGPLPTMALPASDDPALQAA